MTQDEFYHSYRKSLSLEWLPTTPFDFLQLARQGKCNQYPEMRQAYIDAANEKYTHAVVYETAKRVGFYEMRTHAENQTWPSWQKTYSQVCDEHRSGADFTLPKSQRLEQKPDVASPDVANEYLSKMAEILGA